MDDVLDNKIMRSLPIKSGLEPPQLVATCSDLSCYTDLNNNNENFTQVKFEDDVDSFYNSKNSSGEKVLGVKSFQTLTIVGTIDCNYLYCVGTAWLYSPKIRHAWMRHPARIKRVESNV